MDVPRGRCHGHASGNAPGDPAVLAEGLTSHGHTCVHGPRWRHAQAAPDRTPSKAAHSRTVQNTCAAVTTRRLPGQRQPADGHRARRSQRDVMGTPDRLLIGSHDATQKRTPSEKAAGCVTPSTSLGAGDTGRPDPAGRSPPAGGKTGGTTKPPRQREEGSAVRRRSPPVQPSGRPRGLVPPQKQAPAGRRRQRRRHAVWTSRADFQGGGEWENDGRAPGRRRPGRPAGRLRPWRGCGEPGPRGSH